MRYENEKWKTISGYMEADGAKKYAAAFLAKEAKKIDERQANGTYVPATSTTTTKENGNSKDKVVADGIPDAIHQNGVDQDKQPGVPDEEANTSRSVLKMEDDSGDNESNEI